MRATATFFALTLVLAPGSLGAQTIADSHTRPARGVDRGHFAVQAAAGSTTRGGNVQGVSFGYSLNRYLALLFGADRIHVPTRVERFERGSAATRGGTWALLTGELQIQVLPDRRATPYVVAGAGAGISRPNVNAIFPDRVTNSMGMVYSGAGLRVAVSPHLDLFAESRFALAAERDVVMLSIPIRGGVAWRF